MNISPRKHQRQQQRVQHPEHDIPPVVSQQPRQTASLLRIGGQRRLGDQQQTERRGCVKYFNYNRQTDIDR